MGENQSFSVRDRFIYGDYSFASPYKDGKNELRTSRLDRKRIWDSFSRIHKLSVVRGRKPMHSELELALIAEAILATEVDGPILEFGCYQGLSTTKLSLVAKITGKKLYVFDSFLGLPEPEDYEKYERYSTVGFHKWNKGEYKSSLPQVRKHVTEYGCVDMCEFIPGFFSDTLKGFNVRPSLIFEDADLISSVEVVLQACYPNMPKGSIFYTHEANLLNFMTHFFITSGFWKANFGECPPYLVGGYTGLADHAPSLAYFVKK